MPRLSLFFGLCLMWTSLFAGPVGADEEYGGRIAKPRNPKDLCETADSNLTRAVGAVLAARHPPPAAASATARWDRKTAPQWLERFEQRFTLRPSEREVLYRHGLVVPQRLAFPGYTQAFHEIYQSQLPIYVSADAILHAVYAVNDSLVAELERKLVLPRLNHLVATLRLGLPAAAASYPPEVARDLDLYLTVAARLLGEKAAPLLDAAAGSQAQSLTASALAARELATVELFGRPRLIDFTQYAARGHYAGDDALKTLFVAAMWLSRLEFNLVSRSSRSSAPGVSPDPRETPREALVALALADLAQRTNELGEAAELDRVWTLLAGRREDVSLAALTELRTRAGILDLRRPDAAARLRDAIGSRFRRTTPLHPMPEGTTELPAIATLLGPRVVADTTAIRPLVHTAVPSRYRLGVADLAYALGQDRALDYLGEELRTFPTLRGQLERARLIVAGAGAEARSDAGDLYSAWLAAVRGLAARPVGQLPSFMDTPAFADLRLNSVVAGFGQIRHNYALIAGQGYEFGGCEIPDGYVEPVPALYKALGEYARRGEQTLRALDPKDSTGGRAYFARLGRILRVLDAISTDELAGRPLTVEERRFLSMVVEMTPGSTGGPPTYTGWYFDLFRKRADDGLRPSSFIADYYTSTNLGEAAYAGVHGVRLGLFVIDTGGRPRLTVGPVARAFELHRPLAADRSRLSDEAALELPDAERVSPWAASYTVAAPTTSASFSLSYDPDQSPEITVESPKDAKSATVVFTLLDHHRLPLASLTRTLPAGPSKSVFSFPPKSASGQALTGESVGGLSVRIGEYFDWSEVQRKGGGSGLYLNVGP